MATKPRTHSLSRRALLGAGAGGATGLLVAGCNTFESSGTGGGGGSEGATSLSIVQSTATIDSLDPHYVNNAMLVVPAGLLEGLVMQDDSGTDVVPAMAESW